MHKRRRCVYAVENMQSSISLKQETEYQPVACLDVFTVPSAMAITQSHPHTVTHTVTHT